MNRKKLVLTTFALILTVWISAPHAVRAGGPSPNSTAARVRGSVRFEGKVPAAKPISMAADPRCAQQHHSPVMSQDVVGDANGELQNVIVFVSEGLGDRTFEEPSQPAVIDQK